MTSKTFKSVVSNREVRIWPSASGFAVALADDVSNEAMSTQLAPSDAPALALAILEAAGYESANTGGIITGARQAVCSLKKHIEIEARHAAEAKEQAELEAEALDFMNAVRDATGAKALGGFPAFASGIKSHYLIIARKAREMRKS